jgi:antitoxin component of MazEF toxin-antitoxin module
LALSIPKSFAEKAGLEQDSSVEMSLKNGMLVMAPDAKSRLMLSRLLVLVTRDNRHPEVDTGPAVENEVW